MNFSQKNINLRLDSESSYLSALQKLVPLKDLYDLEASCNYNQTNSWCPVLLKVGEVLQKKFPDELKNPYLLQVWSNLGELVFERSLSNSVMSWGIFGDTFIFQEKNQPSNRVFLLRCRQGQSAVLFEIDLQLNQEDFDLIDEFNKDKNHELSEMNICYTKNHLFIGSKKKIFYADLEDEINDKIDQKSHVCSINVPKEHICNFELQESQD